MVTLLTLYKNSQNEFDPLKNMATMEAPKL